MDLCEGFLWMSGVAYFVFALVPDKTLKSPMSKTVERFMMVLTGLLLVLQLIFRFPFLWFAYGVLWSMLGSLTWLGYAQWNLRWTTETSDIMQASMWLWDIIISVCCFALHL